MLLTLFEYFLSACIQQERFAAEIIESDDDFAPPAAGSAPPAAGTVSGADGRVGGEGDQGCRCAREEPRGGAGGMTTKEVLVQGGPKGVLHNER